MIRYQKGGYSFYFYKYFSFEKNVFNFFCFIKTKFFHNTKFLKKFLVSKKIINHTEHNFLKNQTTIMKIKYLKKKETVSNYNNIINFQLLYFLNNFFVGFLYIKKIIFYTIFGIDPEYLQAVVFFLKNSHNIVKQSVVFFNILVLKKTFFSKLTTLNQTEKIHRLYSNGLFFFQNFFFSKSIQRIMREKKFYIYYQFTETFFKILEFFKVSFMIIQTTFMRIAAKHEFNLFSARNKKMYFNFFVYKVFYDRLSIIIFFFEKISCFFYHDKFSHNSIFFRFFFHLNWDSTILRYSKNFIFNCILLKISINKIIKKINNQFVNLIIVYNADEYKIFSQSFFNLHEFFENYTKKKNLNNLYIQKKILNQTKYRFFCIQIFNNSIKLVLNNLITVIRLLGYNFCQLNKFKKKSNKRLYNFAISEKTKRKGNHWILCLKIQRIVFFFYKIVTTFLNSRIVFCFSNFLNTTYKCTFKNLMFMKKMYNTSILIFLKKKIKYFFTVYSSLFLFDSIVHATILYSKLYFNFMHKSIYNQNISRKRVIQIFFYVIWIKICLRLKKKYISHINHFSIIYLKTLININLNFFYLIVYFYFKTHIHINLLLLLNFFFVGFYNLVFLSNVFFFYKKKKYILFFKFFFFKQELEKFIQKFSHNFFFTKLLNVCFLSIFNSEKFSCETDPFPRIQIIAEHSHIFFDKKKNFYLKKKKNLNEYIKPKNYVFLSTKRLFDLIRI